MAYTDGDITRADQAEAGNGVDSVRSKLRNGETYQVVMGNEADGTRGNSGPALLETDSASAVAGAVYEVRCRSTYGTNVSLCLVDKASDPANGDTIVDMVDLPANGTATLYYPTGFPVTLGAGVCVSTTATTVTLPASNSFRFFWNVDTLG